MLVYVVMRETYGGAYGDITDVYKLYDKRTAAEDFVTFAMTGNKWPQPIFWVGLPMEVNS
jgi:hypothetical protein